MLITLRIILAAMASGIMMLAAVAMFLASQGTLTGNPALATTLLIVCAALAATEIAAFPLVRSGVLASARRRLGEATTDSTEDPAAEVEAVAASAFQTLTLIPAALAESVALLALVSFIVTVDYRFLAFPAIALAIIIALFPTRERVEAFSRRLSESHVR